ncbi:uncharacterized protein LOC132952292 isoform X2 [Metopolophium dirhodum]|uniref:uncharacterized protein LOC132952292 isoform X2 n=1 Tax=Metopolophium dirhodum TaxID=44670 RepID=UPI00298FAAF0|nr:uncharacterized protein LOC132952292 isoform X2 [Metopolophium dirhodum]
MTVWTRLMIILALISTVQWPNSTAQQTKDNNSYWEQYLRSSARHMPKRTRFFDQNTTETTAAITSSYKEDQKNEPVINIKNINVRDLPPANLTKSLFTNENTTNITNKQASTGKKLRKKRISPNPTVSINKFIPDPQVIEKCSLNETFCVKVDNYPKQELSDIFRTSKYMSTSYFGTDTVPNEIHTKISNSNLESLCESKVETIFPQAAITQTNEWHYVIQDLVINNTNFQQGFRVEICIWRQSMRLTAPNSRVILILITA